MRSDPISRWRFLRAYSLTFQILSKYSFLFFLRKIIGKQRTENLLLKTHQKTAQKIVRNILLLKGLYIKIGQTLSIMTNFLPESITKGLEQLQDAVPPHPYSEVEARFQEDFGKQPSEIFKSLEEIPIASASLGQVHVGHLPNGTKLAVKLQYPNIDLIVAQDLRTIRRIFSLLHFLFPTYGLKLVYGECSAMILQELDYEREGKNLEKIRDNFKENPHYVFPKVYWEYSSKKILTTEFIEGVKVTNTDLLKKSEISSHEVAVSLIHAYCKQIFVDGVYHADPHPGNIIVIPPPSPRPSPTRGEGERIPPPSMGAGQGAGDNFKMAFVDFGATATISPPMRNGMTLFVEGLIKKDTKTLSTAMKQMGFIAKEENEEAFDKIVEYFYSKIKGIKIENFRQINVTEFQHLSDILELKKMDISFRELTSTFHVPKDWILLERALLLTMGLVAHLDSTLNPVDIVIPYVEQFVLGTDKKVADLILQTSKEILLSYINLPTELHKTLKKLQEGKITITDKSREKSAERIFQGLRQLSFSLLLIFSISLTYFFDKDGNQAGMIWTRNISLVLGLFLIVGFLRKSK